MGCKAIEGGPGMTFETTYAYINTITVAYITGYIYYSLLLYSICIYSLYYNYGIILSYFCIVLHEHLTLTLLKERKNTALQNINTQNNTLMLGCVYLQRLSPDSIVKRVSGTLSGFSLLITLLLPNNN